MVGKKVVHHLMMSSKDCHYVGGLVNGARIVNQWGDVGTELMVYVTATSPCSWAMRTSSSRPPSTRATSWSTPARSSR